MHDDLIDAVDWALDNGIAKKNKVAIYGASYGGYASLVGLSFTPEKFACGVDVVGPSNLNTMLANMPAYWRSYLDIFKRRVGDPATVEGKKLLNDRSPLFRAAKIKRPLLIAQGANDPRVKAIGSRPNRPRDEEKRRFRAPTFSMPTKAMASCVRKTGCRSTPSPRNSWRNA